MISLRASLLWHHSVMFIMQPDGEGRIWAHSWLWETHCCVCYGSLNGLGRRPEIPCEKKTVRYYSQQNTRWKYVYRASGVMGRGLHTLHSLSGNPIPLLHRSSRSHTRQSHRSESRDYLNTREAKLVTDLTKLMGSVYRFAEWLTLMAQWSSEE